MFNNVDVGCMNVANINVNLKIFCGILGNKKNSPKSSAKNKAEQFFDIAWVMLNLKITFKVAQRSQESNGIFEKFSECLISHRRHAGEQCQRSRWLCYLWRKFGGLIREKRDESCEWSQLFDGCSTQHVTNFEFTETKQIVMSVM